MTKEVALTRLRDAAPYQNALKTLESSARFGLLTSSEQGVQEPNKPLVLSYVPRPVWVVGWDRIPDEIGAIGVGVPPPPGYSPMPTPSGPTFANFYAVVDSGTGEFLFALNDSVN